MKIRKKAATNLWIARLRRKFVSFLAQIVVQVNDTVRRAHGELLIVARPGHRLNLSFATLREREREREKKTMFDKFKNDLKEENSMKMKKQFRLLDAK